MTIERDKEGGGCLHSRAFFARNRDLEQVIAISPALSRMVCHCSRFTCGIVWQKWYGVSLVYTLAQGTNFNGVGLHIQTLSMQVIGDF